MFNFESGVVLVEFSRRNDLPLTVHLLLIGFLRGGW